MCVRDPVIARATGAFPSRLAPPSYSSARWRLAPVYVKIGKPTAGRSVVLDRRRACATLPRKCQVRGRRGSPQTSTPSPLDREGG